MRLLLVGLLSGCSFTVDYPGGGSLLDGGPVDAACGITYAQAVLADAPLLYLRLDDPGPDTQLADSSGHDVVALIGPNTNQNREVPGGLTGDDDPSMEFVGEQGSHVRFDGLPSTWAADFTIEQLVRPLAYVPGQPRGALFVARDAGGGFRWGLVDGRLEVWCHDDGCADPPITGPTVALGDWVHLALVHDGADWLVYADGVQVLSGQLPGYLPPFPGGWFGPSNGMAMNVGLDELALYDVALSPERIAEHARIALDGPACP
jgi:hypothetical protein